MVPWHVADPTALVALGTSLASSHPTLHLEVSDDAVCVWGGYRLHDGSVEIAVYDLEIDLPVDYPNSPPAVREVGGRIPRVPDRHVNADGTLCLGVPESVWLACPNGFQLDDFLSGPVRGFLLGDALVALGHPWPSGEYAHGSDGICEFYVGLIGTCDPSALRLLAVYLGKPWLKGHLRCPCGSGEPLRRCHLDTVRPLLGRLPPRLVQESIKQLHGVQLS